MATYTLSDFSEYKYNANMSFVLNGQTTKIDSLYVSSVVTDFNYDGYNMPMIFVTLQIDKYLAKTMIDNSDKGTFIFNLQKYINAENNTGILQDVIKDTFSYFMTDEINRFDDRADNSSGTTLKATRADVSGDFVTTTIGLLSQDHLNNNKKVINGVINKGNLSAVLFYALNHIKNLVIEPITHNKEFKQMILPPMNSVAKTIAYLNNLHTFYDTPYRFFMDFDATYLLSSSGKAVKKKNEVIQDIYIEVLNDAADASKIQGMCTDKSRSLYYFYVAASDIQRGTNYVADKSFSNITVVDSSGNKGSITLGTSGQSGTKAKTQIVRVSNENTGLINNMKFKMDSAGVYLSVSKVGVDSSIFSINKRYHIICKDIFEDKDYSGTYLLLRRRDIYMQQDDNMAGSVLLTFKLLQSEGGVNTATANTVTITKNPSTATYSKYVTTPK